MANDSRMTTLANLARVYQQAGRYPKNCSAVFIGAVEEAQLKAYASRFYKIVHPALDRHGNDLPDLFGVFATDGTV